jgi:hydroxyacyl-ACP dehydratase HTD2-like protein with hotdog domain
MLSRLALKHLTSPFSIARTYSAATINTAAVDRWIASSEETLLRDSFYPERVADLYITLPTRDGTRRPFTEPEVSKPLAYGHHLAFFHNRTPESRLREDGTDPELCAPEPFVRRMWAGGKITWNPKNPLLIGKGAQAACSIEKVEKKGFNTPGKRPMLFVNQRIDISMTGSTEPSVSEVRAHVYMPEPEVGSLAKGPREGNSHEIC